jgi:uncharacterized protein with GYD domain
MLNYVLMTKLDPASLRDRKRSGREWFRKVQELCPTVKWIAHYSLLGPYDFMDIYEAPDQETAWRISLLSRQLGALSAESWPALAYDRYLDIQETVQATASG